MSSSASSTAPSPSSCHYLLGAKPVSFHGAMRTEPFTVAIVQDAASDERQATIDATIPRIREAAERGAQIVCLKELFNAPYFCKSQRCERFDIAESIPGPTTDVMRKIARELEVVLVV